MFGLEKIQLTLRNDILYLFEIYVICTTYYALVFLRTHIGHHNELLRYIILFFLFLAHMSHIMYIRVLVVVVLLSTLYFISFYDVHGFL